MNPIREYTVLKFLTWVATRRPEVRSLDQLSRPELMRLAAAFEGGNKLETAPGLRHKWEASLDLLVRPRFRFAGYAEALAAAEDLDRLRDPLERYRQVPLHAVFLYSSEDAAVERYIRDNWNALDGLSGNYCDIYPSLKQLHGRSEDVYSLMNDRATSVQPIPGIENVTVSALPGMLFWDRYGESAYFPFFADGGLNDLQIRTLIRHVFDFIRRAPTIESVRRAAERDRAQHLRAAPSNGVEQLRVLFFAANPFATSRLALDVEMRETARKVRMATNRDRLVITQAWATQTEDLLLYLNEVRPHIVHFSGHGSENGEIVLASPAGGSQPVSAEALRSLFAVFKDSVQLVLLNACYSERQASAISEVIPYVIGMNAPITDAGATLFASSFYAALSFDKGIEDAFEQGKVALMLDGVDEDVPLLVRR